MLHTEAVESATLSILKQLMVLPSLKNFALVGGTALALKYGHRTSIDLDLFSCENFNHNALIEELKKVFGKSFEYEAGPGMPGIFGFISEVKIDIIHYPHPLLKPIEVYEGIRMYSSEDIGAMKIQAILGRGRKKDFWDLDELLRYFTLNQLIRWHKEKYPDQILAISIPQAIIYFVDAENSENPLSLNDRTWLDIKKCISQTVRNYLH